MTIETKLNDAITRSISHTETVAVSLDGDLGDVLAAIDHDDYAVTGDTTIDIWGQRDGSAWRLAVTFGS